MNLNQYQNLKERLERMQSERDRAQGTLDQLNRDNKERFGATSKKQLRRLIKELKADLDQENRRYESAVSKFDKELKDASE